MSQQDAAKEQANTRKNVRIVSVFTAAAIGIVGVLVILYAWQLPPFTRHAQFTDNAYVRGQTTFISPQVNGYITEVKVQDFVQVKKGDLLLQIDDRIYRQRVHQAEAQLAMKIAALNNNLQQRKSAEATIAKNEAALKNARAQSLKTQADLKRVKDLTADGSCPCLHPACPSLLIRRDSSPVVTPCCWWSPRFRAVSGRSKPPR